MLYQMRKGRFTEVVKATFFAQTHHKREKRQIHTLFQKMDFYGLSGAKGSSYEGVAKATCFDRSHHKGEKRKMYTLFQKS